MSNMDTQLKDLTEMERMVIGSSVNFVFNIMNNQIYHIEHHDSEMTKLLENNEAAQEDYILLQNFRKIAENITELFADTFNKCSKEELAALMQPGRKLEQFFHDIFESISCGNHEE